MKKILLLTFSLLLFYTCSIVPSKLIVINNTENPIYFQLHTDTVPLVDSHLRFLYPYNTAQPPFVRGYVGDPWADKINKYGIDSALHIFIFQTNQITGNREFVKITDEMIKNIEYERLSFTVKELDSLNWTVVYSGQNKIKEDAIEAP